MSEWWETLEGIARWFLEEAGLEEPPVRPRALAYAWGMELMPTRERVHLRSTNAIVYYDVGASPVQRVGDTFHELGHVAMREANFDAGEDEERFAGFLAGALACPRQAYIRDLRASRWNLAEMVRRYECSWEIAARRIVDVRSAAVTIVDNLTEVKRYVSPWITGPIANAITPYETDLAVLAAGAEHGSLHDANLLSGYIVPPNDTPWMRVITVCGIEELEAKALRSTRPTERVRAMAGGED